MKKKNKSKLLYFEQQRVVLSAEHILQIKGGIGASIDPHG